MDRSLINFETFVGRDFVYEGAKFSRGLSIKGVFIDRFKVL